jgi:F0F1-type ATP synthase membrane subunit c/vacuolar-type H+-ATPase subunit K
MEHNRHRAPEGPLGRARVASLIAGIAIGAAAVGAGWWISHNPDAATGSASANESMPSPDAQQRSADRSTESRNQAVIPSAAAANPSPVTDPVLLLGDSLAVGIAPYVDAGLGDRTLSVDAAEGRGTATSESLLEPYASTSAPIWIVSLGTNDNPDDFAVPARSIVRLAGSDRCVVWFNVWRAGTDDMINATLAGIVSEHPNVHLIPWHETSAMHPEWFSGTDVHPSSSGYAVRGQMAIDAVREYCDQ